MDQGAGTQQPLSIPWRDWLRSADWKDGEYAGEPLDAIVIGSGYGGSVAALRLVEKGYRTLLLERGSEFLAGEFPNDFSQLPKSLRVNVPLRQQPVGRAAGLVEVHVGQGFVAIGGNGLGGGSLINAGVAMQPDADVFQQPQWPAAIRNDAEGLVPWMDAAARALGAQAWDAGLPHGVPLRKTQALGRLAQPLGGTTEGVQVTIDPGKCVQCGDCASGCNVPGAKKTLASTYLDQAVKHGLLTIVTQAEAYTFQPHEDCGTFAWEVRAFATDAQQQFVATREVVADQSPSATHRTLLAPRLFICAGTFGTTQLMQRSQARSAGKLQFSSMLGQRLSANGDSLSWVMDDPQPVSSHGRGVARAQQELAKARAGQPYDRDQLVGPTITAALRVDASERPRPAAVKPALADRLLVEDGAVPRAIAQLARELLATADTLRQLDGWSFRRPRHPGAAAEDPLSASAVRSQHSQVLLTMGHDGSPGRLVWLDDTDRTAPYLPDARKVDAYKAQERAFARLGTRHLQNPIWQPLPHTATELMSGAEVPASVLTVHPLGGCVMGDSVETGVVDDVGRVWVRDPGCPALLDASIATDSVGRDDQTPPDPARPHRYRGLYVLDGSIVPTALGCNPLLAITALAERALAELPALPPRRKATPLRAEPRPVTPRPLVEVPIHATLRETLLARDLRLPPALARSFGTERVAGRFEARFPSDDLLRTMTHAAHGFPVKGRLMIGPEAAGTRFPPVIYKIDGRRSVFRFLPAGVLSSGWWPTVSTVLQALVLFVPLLVVVPLLGKLGPRVMALALAPLLPLPLTRSLLTWWVLRGERDRADGGLGSWKKLPGWVLTMVRQMAHASEKRVMRYRVQLHLRDPASHPAWPRHLVLHARKRVAYRASLPQVLAWMLRLRHRAVDGSSEVVPIRPTFWEQSMDAQVRLRAGLRTLARGVFRMGLENLLAVGTRKGTVPPPLSLGKSGDSTTGLLAAASYPLLYLRFALKTRLFDFRLPAYSNLPVSETLDPDHLLLGPRKVRPQVTWLCVRRGNSSSDTGLESTAPLRLPLLRYARPDGTPSVTRGTWNGQPVARAKSILLTHAFGQSGFTFSFDRQGQGRNLAEALYEAGYEVWILDSRMSTRAPSNREQTTVDQIAFHDIPAAVDTILECLRGELPPSFGDVPLQIAAFAHCIGSAALWMSLLAGTLTHGSRSPTTRAPQLSKLSHVVFSQLHPWVVGGRVPQSKTWLPAMLTKLGLAAIPFAVRGRQDGLAAQVVDRFFASMRAPQAEDHRPDGHDDAAATMRRIRFIDAQLYRQDNLDDRTRSAMNRLFGDANLRLFGQARRFIDHGRLVNEDGVDMFVTPFNIECHLGLPIQLLHGEDNELFDVGGAEQTFEQVGRIHRRLQQDFCRAPQGQQVGFLRIPRYGHLDVLVGRDAHRDVFPHVVDFLRRVEAAPDHVAVAQPAQGHAIRPPALGPFIGWTRREGTKVVVRMSFVVDEGRRAWNCNPGNICLRYASGGRYVSWLAGTIHSVDVNDPSRVVVVDVEFDGMPPSQDWQLLLITETRDPHRLPHSHLLADPQARDGAIDAFIAEATWDSGEPVIPLLSDRRTSYRTSFFKLPEGTFDSLAPQQPVTVVVGSCRYPGLGIDDDRVNVPLHDFLRDGRADLAHIGMLLGDQIYADATAGLADPLSPLERYMERHRDAFARRALGGLLARMPVYMAADDHEWTDNYPSGAPLVRRPWPAWMGPKPAGAPVDPKFGPLDLPTFNMAGRAVRDFQRLQGPWDFTTAPAVLETQRGDPAPFLGDYEFEHGCASFYVLDSRSARTRHPAQVVPDLDRLHRWLLRHHGDGRLLVIATGSVVLPGLRPHADPTDGGPPDTWQYDPRHRAELLDMLVRHARGRFVLLSGDYHVSGMVDLDLDGDVVGAAVVAPPLYAPLVYANTWPEAVFVEEQVPLAAGRLRMRVRDDGKFARGSGVGLLALAPAVGGRPRIADLRYHRRLWVWEEGRSVEYGQLPVLSAGTPPVAATAPGPAPAPLAPANVPTP